MAQALVAGKGEVILPGHDMHLGASVCQQSDRSVERAGVDRHQQVEAARDAGEKLRQQTFFVADNHADGNTGHPVLASERKEFRLRKTNDQLKPGA